MPDGPSRAEAPTVGPASEGADPGFRVLLRAAAEMALWAVLTLALASSVANAWNRFAVDLLTVSARWLLVMAAGLVLWYRLSPAWRKPFALGVGAAFLLARTPHALAPMAFCLAMYYLPGLARIPPRARLALFVAGLLAFSWASALCLPRDLAMKAFWVMLLHRFLVKTAYWYYERSVLMKESPPLVDYLFYFLGLPFALDFSNCSFLYLERRKCASVSPDLVLRGLALMRGWWVALLARAAVPSLFPDMFRLMREVGNDADVLLQTPRIEGCAFVLLSLVIGYITYAFGKDWSIAALRMLGYDAESAFNRPLTSSSPAEFWRRYHVYLYEFVRSVFFFPVATFLVRRFPRHPDLCVFTAVLATFLGLGCLDLLPLAFYPRGLADTPPWPFVVTTFQFVLSFGLLVAVSILLEGVAARRGLRLSRPAALALKWGLGVPFTLLAVGILRAVFRMSKGVRVPASEPSLLDAPRILLHLLGFDW